MKSTTCFCVCLMINVGVQAEIIFSEDFNDGRFNWSRAFSGPQPSYSAASGDLVIAQESPGGDAGTIVWANSERRVLDSSTRAQVSLENSGAVAIVARANNSVLSWLQAGFRADIEALYLGWNNASGFTEFIEPVEFHHDFTESRDLIMQLDVFGDDYHLSAWPAGDLPPTEPQIVFTNEQVELAEGVPGLQIVVDREQPGSITRGIFRHLIVADQPLLFGDLNTDGTVDAHDIDDLSKRIQRNADFDFAFDMNGDVEVDERDRTFWVSQLQNTYFGDANLDGEFDSKDFVTVFQAGKYEEDLDAGWSDGDWSGDARFDSHDFVIAFRDSGYEKGRREGEFVPEPSSSIGIIFLLFAVTIRRSAASLPNLG